MTATWEGGWYPQGWRSGSLSTWVVVSTTCMGGPCGPRVGAVADPFIMATDFVEWTMTLLRERSEMVTSSKSLACWETVGPASGVWGSCGVCATVSLVSSAKPTWGERRGVGCVSGVILFDRDG